jgi:hypothetical protein
MTARIVIDKQLSYAGVQDGVNIRNPSSALLGISSSDRYPSTVAAELTPISPYDFSIQSNQNLLSGFFTRIAVTEIDFNWTLPTLTNRDNTIGLDYFVGGVSTIYTIALTTTSWATPTVLAAALQAAIRTATGNNGFTVSYDTANYAFTAATNNADVFFLYRVNNVITEPNRTTLFEMMNWPPSIIGASSVKSGVPTMLSTPFVDIVCNQLTYNQALKDADTGPITRDIMCRIFLIPDAYTDDPTLLGSAPLRIHRQFTTPKEIRWLPNQPIGNLKFEVYDSQGYLLGRKDATGLPVLDTNQGDWNLTVLVSEV